MGEMLTFNRRRDTSEAGGEVVREEKTHKSIRGQSQGVKRFNFLWPPCFQGSKSKVVFYRQERCQFLGGSRKAESVYFSDW